MSDLPMDVLWGPSTYVLRVTLENVEPEIWRKVRVTSDLELADLHQVLGLAMGWQGYHLHEFEVGGIRFGVTEDDENLIDQDGIRVEQLLPAVGASVEWSYDFGDGWTHRVVVEAIELRDGVTDILVVDGARACPPEDSGGPWSYLDKVRILADPTDDEHESIVEWMPDDFDADAFDLDEAIARVNTR